jgi:hypothetical protein
VALDLDRLGVALQRQLAGDRQVVAGTADVLCLEAEMRNRSASKKSGFWRWASRLGSLT